VRRAILGCLLLAALSLLLPSTPTYDPWSWLLWGREILGGDLNTRFGPSWKPFPMVFTTVYAVFGDAAPALWLITARAGGLLALVMVYRLTVRGAGGSGRLVGGVIAVGALISVSLLARLTALGHSEGLLVAFVLWSIERHLDGERRCAFILAFAAALIRPEVWPFLGLYGLLLWTKEPEDRALVASLLLLVPALWLLPELWGSGDAFRASERAKAPDPGTAILAANPALEALRGAEALVRLPIHLAALTALVFALVRRERTPLLMAAGAVSWVALVVAMTAVGYPGVPRLMLPAAALLCVLAGIAAIRLVDVAGGGRRSTAVAVVLLLAAVAYAIPRVGSTTELALQLRSEAELSGDLATAVERVGGPDRVLACGHPSTAPLQVPAVAWQLRVPISSVAIDAQVPGVVFRTMDPFAGTLLPVIDPGDGRRFHEVVTVGGQQVLASCAELASARPD
jgi:hypothetical protein